MPTRPVLRILLVILPLVVAACAAEPSGAPTTTTSPTTGPTVDNQGGFGPPSRAEGEFVDLPGPSVVSGTLWLSGDGCWYVDLNGTRRLAVFPVGISLGERDATTLIDADGDVYRSGDLVDGSASLLMTANVPGGSDGKWGNYLAFCDPTPTELILFDTMTMGSDPSALPHRDLLEMVATAEFTDAWPCGRGWAVSSADQQVGLLIYETGNAPAGTGPQIDLPDERWDARVVVGTHLFAQHCNDAIEPWVAMPSVTAAWPVVAGRLDLADPLPAPSDPPAVVRATLVGGAIDSGSGRIDLPPIELLNIAFNAFAG